MYIISLTAIPPRFGLLGPTLDSLLRQEVTPESIRLYIPKRYRRFPDWDGRLPEVPKGIEIRQPEEDLGPASKVLFAAAELAGQEIDILFCDDDREYLPSWSTRILNAAREHPGAAIVTSALQIERIGLDWSGPRRKPLGVGRYSKTWDLGYHWQRLQQNIAHGGKRNVPWEMKAPRNRIRRSGYFDIGEGCGGFLIRPGSLDEDAWNIPPVMWAVDDVWISGQLARKGIPIWGEAGASQYRTTRSQHKDALYAAVIDGANRDQANRACAIYMRDTYGIWGGTAA